MKKTSIRALVLPLLVAVSVSAALAAGGSKLEEPEAAATGPEQQANERYNLGLAARDGAWRLEKQLAGAPAEQRDKLEKKIRGAYEEAVRHFRSAVALFPEHHQALGSLGYAQRQLGHYEEAMQAYDAALALAPDYVEAIEYRGEALLGLGRINEAQNAYRVLAEKKPDLAAELLGAMRSWIEARRSDGGADAAQLDGLESWIADRGAVATGSSLHKSRSW